MHKKQLKRTLESLHLQLVDYALGTGNSADLNLQAPDGAQQKFTITRLDDPGSDRINIGEMRRFAQAHQTSHTLPGVMELDVVLLNVTPKETSDVEIASRAVAYGNNPRLKQRVAEKLEHSGMPYNIDNVIVNGASAPVHEDPIPASIEAIEKLIATKQPARKKTMPAKTTTLKAVAAPAPEVVKPKRALRVQNKLGQANFFKVCQYLLTLDMKGTTTLQQLRERLQPSFEFTIAVSSVREMLDVTGVKLDVPKHGVTTLEAQKIIARSLVALMTKMGEDVPEDLSDLAAG